MQQMKVELVGTTDDPVDPLNIIKRLHRILPFNIREVVPSWRPDRAFKIELSLSTNILLRLKTSAISRNSRTFDGLKKALTKRLIILIE